MKKHSGEKLNLSVTNFENTLEDTHWRKADRQSLNGLNYHHPTSLSSLVSGKAVTLLVISSYVSVNSRSII